MEASVSAGRLGIAIEAARKRFGDEYVARLSAAGQSRNGMVWVELREVNEIRVALGIEPLLPQAREMAANALGAAGRLAAAMATGQQVLVDGSVLALRGGYCAVCNWHRASDGRCGSCGCWSMKLELATERCPRGYWERVV